MKNHKEQAEKRAKEYVRQSMITGGLISACATKDFYEGYLDAIEQEGVEELKCPICDKVTYNIHELVGHVIHDHSDPKYKDAQIAKLREALPSQIDAIVYRELATLYRKDMSSIPCKTREELRQLITSKIKKEVDNILNQSQ